LFTVNADNAETVMYGSKQGVISEFRELAKNNFSELHCPVRATEITGIFI